MVIQSTQVLMYTKHILFCIFLIFQFFYYFYMKNKINKTENNKQKHVKQSIKLAWLKIKAKHTSYAKTKTRRERRKWENYLELFSFHTLEEPFLWLNPWTSGEGEELKSLEFERNMRALRRSPRGARKDWSWFWLPDVIIPLFYWVANHL